MKLNVWFDDPVNASVLESFIHSKTESAFSRFSHRLASGEVRLRREQQATGNMMHCSLELKSHSRGTIHITESAENGCAAILKAIRAARVKLKRSSERRKDASRARNRSVKRGDIMAELSYS